MGSILAGFFAGQLKAAIGGQNIFDPMNGAPNVAFGAIIIVGAGLHRHVFAVVFQGEEESVADGQSGRFADGLVQLVVGGLQNVEHHLEDGFGRSDAAFEFVVCPFQSLIDGSHVLLDRKRNFATIRPTAP